MIKPSIKSKHETSRLGIVILEPSVNHNTNKVLKANDTNVIQLVSPIVHTVS